MFHFHFAPIVLGAGSTIDPGNFGRLLKSHHLILRNANTGETFVDLMVAREVYFELKRQTGFQQHPSRMNCVFCCPTMDEAKKYALFVPQTHNILYEVEPVDSNAPQHTGYISFTDYTPDASFIDDTDARAQNYWSGATGDPDKGVEVLVGGAVRVIRAV